MTNGDLYRLWKVRKFTSKSGDDLFYRSRRRAMTLGTSNRLDSAFDAIYAAIAELNLQMPKNRQIQPRPDTALFGEKGQLDSLALANFIVITEQKLEESFGIQLDLTQDDPFSGQNGYFRTIESLARYISSFAETKSSE